jgi:hypothetical protein
MSPTSASDYSGTAPARKLRYADGREVVLTSAPQGFRTKAGGR